jgi:hypothetical protein
VERARVIPVLCGLREPDMTRHPLTMFNYVKLDEPGVRKIVETINANATDHKLPKDKLDQVFEKWWPDFEAHINRIEETPGSVPKKVFDLEGSIEEMLSLMRSISRRTTLPDLQLPSDTDAASPTFTTLGDLKVSLPPFPNLERAREAFERLKPVSNEFAEAMAKLRESGFGAAQFKLPQTRLPEDPPAKPPRSRGRGKGRRAGAAKK